MYDWLVPLFFPSGVPTGVDLNDPERCVEAALDAAAADLPTSGDEQALGTRRLVPTQLLAGELTELQDAAQLLLSEGRSASRTWAALDLAFEDAAEHSSDADEVISIFRANLELLPLPDEDEIAATYRELAASPIPLDDLDDTVAHRLAMDLDVPMVESMLETVLDHLMTDGSL